MERSAAEQVVRRDLDASTGLGQPISSRARMAQRSVEAYLKAGVRPRWMERIAEIDQSIAAQRRRFARAHHQLREECAPTPRSSPGAGASTSGAAGSTSSTS